MSRRVLPIVIALLAVAQIATAAVGAAGIRADQRRVAAEARERRAVALYREQLRAPAVAVFDAVQPLQDVDDALGEPGPGQYVVRNDVLAHSGAADDLAKARTALQALHVPASLRAPAADLDRQLTAFQSAAQRLAAAATSRAARVGSSPQLTGGYYALEQAQTDWSIALQKVYGTMPPPASPSSYRVQGPDRRVPTHGGWIQHSDEICARADVAVYALPDLGTPQNLLRYGPKYTEIVGKALQRLEQQQPDPSRAAEVQRRIGRLLKASEAVPRSMSAMISAARSGNLPALRAAAAALDRSLPSFGNLSEAYRAHGVSLCAASFELGDDLVKDGGSLGA